MREHTEFEIRYTYDRRIVPITDQIQCKILNILDQRRAETSELCNLLNIPQSTTYLILGKMIRNGLISKTDEESKRNVSYVSNSISIIDCEKDVSDVTKDLQHIWNKVEDKKLAFVLMTGIYLRKSTGISYNQVFTEFGKLLAIDLDKNCPNLETAILPRGLIQAFSNFVDIKIESSVPLKISITLNNIYFKHFTGLISIFTGYVKQSVELYTGHYANIIDKEVSYEDEKEKLTLTFEIRYELEGTKPILYSITPGINDKSEFMLIKKENSTVLVDDVAWCNILKLLSDSSLPIQKIVKMSGLPKSTSLFNIKKMSIDGFISVFMDSDGTMIAEKKCDILIHRHRPISSVNHSWALNKSSCNETDFVISLAECFITLIEHLGFDAHYLIENIGRSVFSIIYSSKMESDKLIALNNFLEMPYITVVNPKCESLVPLTISFDYIDKENDAGSYILNCIIGIICELIGKIGGNDLYITKEIVETETCRRIYCTYKEKHRISYNSGEKQ